MKVRCPNKAPLSFHGASGDVTGPKSDTWRRALTREIGVLRREVRPRPPPPPSPPPESTTASGGVDAGIGPWRLWGALSGGVAKAGIAQKVRSEISYCQFKIRHAWVAGGRWYESTDEYNRSLYR